jgi:hypothetical protein
MKSSNEIESTYAEDTNQQQNINNTYTQEYTYTPGIEETNNNTTFTHETNIQEQTSQEENILITIRQNNEELETNQNQENNKDTRVADREENIQEEENNRRQLINEDKGDSIYTKNKGTTRFLYQNINSLRPPKLDKWKATLKELTE